MQERIAEMFPNARIVRMDVDTTRRKEEQHEAVLKQFESEADIFNWNANDCEKDLISNIVVGVLCERCDEIFLTRKNIPTRPKFQDVRGRGDKPGELYPNLP